MKKRNTRLRILDLPEDCLFEITNFIGSRNDFLSFILTSKYFYNLSNSKFFFGFSNVKFKPIDNFSTEDFPSGDLYFVHTLRFRFEGFKKSLKLIRWFPRLTKLFITNSTVKFLLSNDFFESLKYVKVLEYELDEVHKNFFEDKCLHLEKLENIERLSIVDSRNMSNREEAFSFSGCSIVNRTLKDLSLHRVNFKNYNFLKELSALLKLKIIGIYMGEFNTTWSGEPLMSLTNSSFVNFTNLEELEIFFYSNDEITNDMFKNMKNLKVLKLEYFSTNFDINFNNPNFLLLQYLPNLNSLVYKRSLFHEISENEKKLLLNIPNVVLCKCENKNATLFKDYTMKKCKNENDHFSKQRALNNVCHFFCPNCICYICLEKFDCIGEIITCKGCKKKVCVKCVISECVRCSDVFNGPKVCQNCFKIEEIRNMKGLECLKECDVCFEKKCIRRKQSNNLKICYLCEKTK